MSPAGKRIWATMHAGPIVKDDATEEGEAEVKSVFPHFEGKKPGEDHSFEEGFAVLATKLERLERLDRYERRAVTRFRKALRLFGPHGAEFEIRSDSIKDKQEV